MTHPMGPGADGAVAFDGRPLSLTSLMFAGAPALRHVLLTQDRIMIELEDHARRWFERRHAQSARALDATIDLVNPSGDDPGRAMRIASGVLGSAVEALAADARDGVALFGRCLGLVADRGPATGADMLPRVAPVAAQEGSKPLRDRH